MNRALIESDPHAVLEGLLIGGYAIGAGQGIIYVRAEYPLAVKRLKHAIAKMYQYGLLGDNILGSGFSFDILIKEGAGAFVCGEETALLNALEGLRGEVRIRPPYPTTAGLFGKPTIITNAQALASRRVVRRFKEARDGSELAKAALNDLQAAGFGVWTKSTGPGRPTEHLQLHRVPESPKPNPEEGFRDIGDMPPAPEGT